MAKYKIDFIEKKGADWKIATLIAEDGHPTNEVSINRKSKSGEVTQNFDNLMAGSAVEGELWRSPAGKWYLFPSKPQGGANKSFGGNVSRLMDKKAENIKEAQERKSDSIAYFNSLNSAISFVTSFRSEIYVMSQADFFDRVCEYRDLFLEEYYKYQEKDVTDKTTPF